MRVRPSIPLLLDLLRIAMRKQATAIYIVPWMPPTLRIDEHSVPLSSVSFTPEQSTLLVLDMLDDAHRAALDRSREIQFSLVLEDLGRFRIHAFRRHGQPAMAIRPFAVDVPTPRTLALPALACTAAMADRGLLVLASRSLGLRRDAAAALLEHRNRSGQGELALLDDASRFWHERVRCHVRQGLSTGAVDELLLRRGARMPTGSTPPGPLAIAWGDLRDGPQLERAVRAADRALCLVTLDADDLMTALHRLIALAAETGGADLRHRCALNLHGLLALRPVRAAGGDRDLAATVSLMNSPELAANLAEGDIAALRQTIAAPAARGGSSGADEHLWQLLVQGLVTPDDALACASDRDAFSRRASTTAPQVEPSPATAPVRVDTGFADVFDPTARTADPFDFAEAPAPARSADTQFDRVDWVDDPSPPQTVRSATATASAPPSTMASAPDAESMQRTVPLVAPLAHSAQFHAWAPAAVAPGSTVPIDLWIALPGQAAQVTSRARLASDVAASSPLADDGSPQVALQLRIDGVLPSPHSQRLAWKSRPDRVRFAVLVPARTRPGAHAARVKLTVGGLPVGELSFVLEVVSGAANNLPLEDMQAVRHMLRSAYASFAPTERDDVLACVQALQQVAPGLDVFVDAPLLRSSEQWRERIERELSRRERLFLFWSGAAADSPWVDFEWRLMMRHGGPGLIDAVLLEPPRLAPLPPELADLASAEVRWRNVGPSRAVAHRRRSRPSI